MTRTTPELDSLSETVVILNLSQVMRTTPELDSPSGTVVMLNLSQMTRTTPELDSFSKLPHCTSGRTFGHYVSFRAQQVPYMADPQNGAWFRSWNRPAPKLTPYQ
ncbi:hypothetical protein AVEN_41828-1 [Araneus ventricosus]|uniref:Uncharacterized protein n=1 Tax=Araneus ventricosus TaxID=182803 RepID=A0A4Y2ACL8_ARAVE|nr:hypothetical protein AVEN_41828-1 [Araneus ventricosus]